jgi:hypothetical protein
MNFITDNFVTNFFNNSTKTDEDLDKFINKKFTYYLNNSNLLLNFVSDFEDYKTNGRNDDRSKCDECENLYILTSEIFENYINRVKIPFDITIYSEGKEKSNINYNNKVLYFFDLKDLNKILQSKNLAKNNEDTKILNKKRILCKIISLSFIKIYIIIKSIFQTFNIYSSLIKNKTTVPDNLLQPPLAPAFESPIMTQPPGNQFERPPDNQFERPPTFERPPDNQFERPPDNQFERPPNNQFERPPDNHFERPPTFERPPDNQFERQATMTQPQDNPFERPPTMTQPTNQFERPSTFEPSSMTQPTNLNLNNFETKQATEFNHQRELEDKNDIAQGLEFPIQNSYEQQQQQQQQEQQQQQPSTQFSGGAGIFDFLNPFSKKKEDIKYEAPDEYLPQRIMRLQTSNNVFYSIFVILFENTEIELTSKNFTADYLNKNLNTLKNENLLSKLPKLLEYICSNKLYLPDFISKNSLIFNDNNFKFLRLKTSDTLENDASYYLDEIDKKYKKNTIDNTKKIKASHQCFTQENIAFIENYCKTNNYSELMNITILNSVKGFLQKMITNYFKNRNKLYDSIIKKLIKFNPRTNEIENINPNLTYAKIVDLTEQTKNILLDLHIDVLKSLNNIVNKIRTLLLHKYGVTLSATNNDETETDIKGGKTRKRNYKNYKNYKKNKKYTRK